MRFGSGKTKPKSYPKKPSKAPQNISLEMAFIVKVYRSMTMQKHTDSRATLLELSSSGAQLCKSVWIGVQLYNS